MNKELRIIGTVFAYIPVMVPLLLGIGAFNLFDEIRYKIWRRKLKWKKSNHC